MAEQVRPRKSGVAYSPGSVLSAERLPPLVAQHATNAHCCSTLGHMAEQHDPYGPIARYYALEQGELNDDLPFFTALARQTGGPVLDLGCGDGRVAEALAALGLPVTAVDSSPAMLALAHRRVGGRAGSAVAVQQGDLVRLRAGGGFKLAICAAGTFAHVTTTEDQLRALRAIHRSLAPGGRLALVLQNPYQLVVDPPNGELVVQWRGVDPETGNAITKLVTNEADLAEQQLYVSVAYDVTQRDGLMRRYASEFTLRWSYRPELELLLQRAGFSIEAWYGDYEGGGYAGESPLLIALAARG